MIKILSVFGTRPEAIKMAPLINILAHNPNFDSRVCVTAQHRAMLDQVLDFFEITPDYDLNVMRANQDLYDITSAILEGLKSVFNNFKPDLLLVHGDTATSFAAALAGFYSQIKIGHVEAGLRTWNLQSPWPEEGYRQMTDVLSHLHFAPTDTTKINLLKSGVQHDSIAVTGNTVIDALKYAVAKIENDESLKSKIIKSISDRGFCLYSSREVILITGHRRENFGDGFMSICEAIKALSRLYPGFDFVYPVHLNPNVLGPVNKILSGLSNVYLIDPLTYPEFVFLMSKCLLILTDSGGVQEEAPSLQKPVLVMRNTTERPEALEVGAIRLVGTNIDVIIDNFTQIIENQDVYRSMTSAANPYGCGNSSSKIISFIEKTFL